MHKFCFKKQIKTSLQIVTSEVGFRLEARAEGWMRSSLIFLCYAQIIYMGALEKLSHNYDLQGEGTRVSL